MFSDSNLHHKITLGELYERDSSEKQRPPMKISIKKKLPRPILGSVLSLAQKCADCTVISQLNVYSMPYDTIQSNSNAKLTTNYPLRIKFPLARKNILENPIHSFTTRSKTFTESRPQSKDNTFAHLSSRKSSKAYIRNHEIINFLKNKKSTKKPTSCR